MNKFTLGAVSGMTALTMAVPLVAQVSSAASSDASSATIVTDKVFARASAEDIQGMIERDDALLANIDSMVVVLKSATQTRRNALASAATISDATTREEAVKKAMENFRTAMQEALQANPDLKGVLMPFGGPGGGRGHMMMGRGGFPMDIAAKLGMSEEEVKAALEEGKTIEDLAKEKGIELPEFKMHFSGDLAKKLGMTAEDLKAALESGKTIEDLAKEKGLELPQRGKHMFHMKLNGDAAASAGTSSAQ